MAVLLSQSPTICQAGVTSHYSFDAGTVYTDSVGSYHGTLVDSGTSGNSGITTTTELLHQLYLADQSMEPRVELFFFIGQGFGEDLGRAGGNRRHG